MVLRGSLVDCLYLPMSDDEVYEVSHILDEDYSIPNERVFLVRWLGYSANFDSWEPLEHLKDGAIEVVQEWDRKKKQLQKRRTREKESDQDQGIQSTRTTKAVARGTGRKRGRGRGRGKGIGSSRVGPNVLSY